MLALGCVLVAGSGAPHANAEGKTIIRFATLAPSGSTFGKVLNAWSRSLAKETEGRVELRIYSGGSQGDERDFIRKMRAGQMDAAGLTTTGLGILVRPVLVLSAPGLIETYEQLARVRQKMSEPFAQMFEKEGFVLLAWSDAGKGRIMSTAPIVRPADLKEHRPWAWKDDPMFAEFLQVVGANAVRLGVPEVYAALQTQMVDVVPCSALAAVVLQWYTKLNYISKDTFGIILGASVVKKENFDRLSPADQKALKDTAARAADFLDQIVQRDDAKAYRVLLRRGLQELDAGPYQAEWNDAMAETRKRLTGRIFSKSLLDQVQAAANATGGP